MNAAFLREAIEQAARNVHRGGGPFAALVVKDDTVIAAGSNCVTASNDPTAHAEIVAIREACRVLGGFQLTACDVYCSCEPCPMCLGALFWARPARVFFAATAADAAAAGFDDSLIYHQLSLPPDARAIPMVRVPDPSALRPFEEWARRPDKVLY
jgi:guanine deaminase